MIAHPLMKIFFIDAAGYDRIPIGEPLPDDLIPDSRMYDTEALRKINFHVNFPLETDE